MPCRGCVRSVMQQLAEPKAAVIVDGKKRITSRFVDGMEMVEEFDLVTDELLVRKRRKPTTLGGEGEWTFEVGAPSGVFRDDRDLLRESSSNPQVARKDTAEAFVFRVRNLPSPPYAADMFSVAVDTAAQRIVVRTSNRKYYARLEIEEMSRHGIDLVPDHLSWEYKLHTLVITYTKHLSTRVAETQAKKERAALKAERKTESEQCPQQ